MSEGSRPRTVTRQHSLTPQQQQRRRRRLPHVQRTGRSRPLTYWPSYKVALDWLRRHHGILDTALGLLEIYPALLQDRCLDVLWEFLSPFLASNGHSSKTSARVRGRLREAPSVASSSSKHSRQTKPRTAPTLTSRQRAKPAVTCSSAAPTKAEDPSPCGGSGDTSTTASSRAGSRDPQDLPPLISVTCSQDHPEPELQGLLEEGEEEEDSGAGACQVPCVYVCCLCRHRPHTEKEPVEDRLGRHVLHALQHHCYVRTGPCAEGEEGDCSAEELSDVDVSVFVLGEGSLNSPACWRRLYALWCLHTPALFVKDGDYCLPSPLPDSVLRCIQALESAHVPLTSSPRHFPTPRSATPRCGLSIPTLTTSSPHPGQHRQQERGRGKGGRGGQDSDFMLFVLTGYRTALVFEEGGLGGCESLLRERVLVTAGLDADVTGGVTSSLTLSTPSSAHPWEANNALLPNGFQNHLTLLTPSQRERSPDKHSSSHRLCDHGEEKNSGQQQQHRSSAGENLLGLSALSNSTSAPVATHLLSVGCFTANGHTATRLGSPPPVKVATNSEATPPLPPVRSPASSRKHHLDPFTHLPRL